MVSTPFGITAATNLVELDAQNRGRGTFTVSNRSGRVIRGRSEVVPAHHYAPPPMDSPTQSGLGRLRELVASAACLSMRRGTVTGILRFLEVATGIGGFAVHVHVADRPFHVRFTGPKDAQPFAAMIARIIEMEKPAYVTFELAFAGAEKGG